MSEFQSYPIPNKEQYDDFFVSYDEVIVAHGGALEVVRNYEYQAVHESRLLFDYVKSIGEVALVIEPKDIRGIRCDPLMLATHSFKRGLLLGLQASHHMHEGHVASDEVLDAVKNGFRHQELSGERVDQLEHIPLFEWSGQGLAAMGEQSRRVIRLWSEDITTDPVHRKLFEYGVGAVSVTSEAIVMNENIDAAEAHFKRPDWSDEIEQILASNTGE